MPLPIAIALMLVLALAPGCVVRRRVISRQTAPGSPPRQLATASRDELIRRVRLNYEAVKSLTATADMTPALGSVYKGEITEYKDVRAYLLFRKPMSIRIIGLYPVVRSKAFDMVSDGTAFRIFIPSKNRFIEGRNDAPAASKNSLENLRPEAFLEALLIPPPSADEDAVLEDATDEDEALYILHLIRKTPAGNLMLSRNIWFDRLTLRIVRQKAFDSDGNIVSDTRYKDWKIVSGVSFPETIDINRPKDGYGVVMTMIKLEMNTPTPNEKFVLEQPEGSQLQLIGNTGSVETIKEAQH